MTSAMALRPRSPRDRVTPASCESLRHETSPFDLHRGRPLRPGPGCRICFRRADGAFALKELKVGGPLYASIKLGNDLVADILPPPAYVIEAYLETTLALREPKNLEPHEKKLTQLKKDYEDRRRSGPHLIFDRP